MILRHCEEHLRRSNPRLRFSTKTGLLRGACHWARIRATRWLAMMGWTAPRTASMCQTGDVDSTRRREPSMGEISMIGLDLAKNVFQVHGVDASGAVVV